MNHVLILLFGTLAICLQVNAVVMDDAAKCVFQDGDGDGDSDIRIGFWKGWKCIWRCLEMRGKIDGSINGVTERKNTLKGGCWCERNMRTIKRNKKYKACKIRESLPKKMDNQCIFAVGDGIDDGQFKVGDQKGKACVDACLKRKKEVDNSITGIGVFTDTRKGGCWCLTNMTGRNSDTKYTSCFIARAGLNGDGRCTFFPGDGNSVSKGEVKLGEQEGSHCIDACLQMQLLIDPTITGVAVLTDTNKKGCWCLKGMTRRKSDTNYKSCFIGEAGLNGEARCRFRSGDATSSNEVNVGYQRGSACVDACIKRKKEVDNTINGVAVFRDTSKGGCWCHSTMTGRNKVKKYKSCFLAQK